MTKRIVMALMATAIFASYAMAQSGFEFGITFPIGASISMPSDKMKSGLDAADKITAEEKAFGKGTAGFEWGATLQIGYMFAIGNDMGVSALLDMGYHRDVYAFSSKASLDNGTRDPMTGNFPTKEVNVRTSFEFDTLQIGVLPKFRIKNMAIGLGGGVKIPLGGMNYSQDSSYDDNYEKADANKLETMAQGLTKKNIDDSFKSAIIPYLKVTFDYMLPIDTKTSLTFGAYVGYDFNLDGKIGDKDVGSVFQSQGAGTYYDKVGFGGIDVGVQIGLRFGPSAA